MSYVDFQQAAGIADYILSSGLHERYPQDRFALQGLNCAMVIAYCRPFSGNDQRASLKVPDLPGRILQVLSSEERSLHETLLEERHTMLAHSDSDAWEPQPHYIRIGSSEMLIPSFDYVHSPLLPEVVEQVKAMSDKLREACFEERQRLEAEVKPYLAVVEYDEEEVRRQAEERGVRLPRREPTA